MNKLLLFTLLSGITITAADAQTPTPTPPGQTPAMFDRDSEGNASLIIPGQGTPFNLHTSSVPYNGVRDDQLVIGYNHTMAGGQYDPTEPQVRIGLESNYNDGTNRWIEWNLDTVTPDSAHIRRWMQLAVTRNPGSPQLGAWTWWGHYFSLQNYNSPTSDVPTEYFTVTRDGIAKLTSRAGQPSQIHLNTTDVNGYPGAYTSLVWQRAGQTKWIMTNQGANGDALSISTPGAEVASFRQGGLFTSKGQRTAVTTKTASYTATPADSEIRANCTGGAVTIRLPAATGSGQTYRIKKIDATTNAATIGVTGADRIDGATAISLPNQYNSVTVVDGAPGVWDLF